MEQAETMKGGVKMEGQVIETTGTKAESVIDEEEIIDAELDVQAFDLTEQTLERFDDFLTKMSFMLRQIETYGADDDGGEDNNQVIKSVMTDLIIAKASWVCLRKGKMAQKAQDAKWKLETVRRGEAAKAALLGRADA